MTGSIRIFEKSNFTPKLSVLVFLKVKLPNMTDWHTDCVKGVAFFGKSTKITSIIQAQVAVPCRLIQKCF